MKCTGKDGDIDMDLKIGTVVQVSGCREQVVTGFHTSTNIYGTSVTPILTWKPISSRLSPETEAKLTDAAIADKWHATVDRLIAGQ